MSFSLSLAEIAKLGSEIYQQKNATEDFEKNHRGSSIVIDVEKKEYIIDRDELVAIEKAKTKFGDKLFFIKRIGGVSPFFRRSLSHAWQI